MHQPVVLSDSELPLVLWLYLRVGYRLSTPSVLGALSMLPIRFVNMSMVCLLAGIASARPSAFVEGEGVEPP